MFATQFTDSPRAEFERFLHASVGEDRNGNIVTVLSTLARFDLDPWDEAAKLASLERGAASSRLGSLLSRFRDVPSLGQNHERVSQDLTLLLPARRTSNLASGEAVTDWTMFSKGAIWLALLFVMFFIQIISTHGPGPGE